MLSVDKLVNHLKEKGVKFSIMSENDAITYLSKNNNFFKLTSYRKNYLKYTNGENADKYEDLEFAYLIELARIDVEIRHILLKMCLDIEHFLKVRLINFVESRVNSGTGEDGYKIVLDFLADEFNEDSNKKAENSKYRKEKVNKRIKQSHNNPYCGDLISKYQTGMPIWVLVEIITFGDLLDIIDFCVTHYSMELPVDRACLDRVRQIRNATSHNNCIINDLNSYSTRIRTPIFITNFVSQAGISKHVRNKKMSNPRINQIVHLFYAYDKIVTSKNTRNIRINELNDLFENRIKQNADYFHSNTILTSTYEFFAKLLKKL